MNDVTNKTPAIDVDMLAMALQGGDLNMVWWLDTHSGHIMPAPDAEADDADQELISAKKRSPRRFVEIEPIVEAVRIELMESYAATIEQDDLCQSLYAALQRKQPVWHFKNTLASAPEYEDQWYEFKEKFYVLQARQWLEERGYTAVDGEAEVGVKNSSMQPGDEPQILMEFCLQGKTQRRRYVICAQQQLQLSAFAGEVDAPQQLLAETPINEHQFAGVNRIIENLHLLIDAQSSTAPSNASLKFRSAGFNVEINGALQSDACFTSLAGQLNMLLGIPDVAL